MAAGFFDTVYMSDVDGSQGWGEDPDHGFTMWRDVEGCVHAAWDGELVTSANPPRPPSRTPEECLEHFVMTRILGEGYDRRFDGTEEQRLMDAGWYRDLEDPLGWCDGDRGVLVWREADGFAYMHEGRPIFEPRGTLSASARRRERAREAASARAAPAGGGGRGRGRGGGGGRHPLGHSA